MGQQHVTWEARTVKDHTDPGRRDLTVADLRWLITEATRLGADDYAPVVYLPPIDDGDPQGWGLSVEVDF